MFFIFAVFLLFKIEKSFICRFLFKIFDFLLYTSLGDLYILNPPKCKPFGMSQHERETVGKRWIKLSFANLMETFDKRRLVGILPERVTNVSNTEYPGHYPDEDFSWNLSNFKKVRCYYTYNSAKQLNKTRSQG